MEESPGERVLKLEDGWDLLTGAGKAERAGCPGVGGGEGCLPGHVIRGMNKRGKGQGLSSPGSTGQASFQSQGVIGFFSCLQKEIYSDSHSRKNSRPPSPGWSPWGFLEPCLEFLLRREKNR